MSTPRTPLPRLLAVLVLLGCDESRVAAPQAADARAPRADVEHGNGILQSVTGYYGFVGTATGNHFQTALTALRHGDSTVTGEVEEHVEVAATGEFVRRDHGTVTCFTIVGNRARIAGTIDRHVGRQELPDSVDSFITVVVDNGEGNGAVPDSASNLVPVTASIAKRFCDVGGPRPIREVEKGNIQIRP